MLTQTKMLLNGAPVRLVTEGAFSEIMVELSEELEALIDHIIRVGDFQVGNSLNPAYTQIKTEFEALLSHLEQYKLNASQFVDETLKKNPNITYAEILGLIREKFL